MRARAYSWGRYPRSPQALARVHDRQAGLPDFEGSALPYGNGRSYGDSCQNPGATLLDCRGLDRFIAFDPASGRLHCEAGVTLDEIIALALPQGWFLPVTPGTRHVTVGGAIGNDVHGKNHHVAGSFGHHVRSFELLRSDGERRLCRPGDADGWFGATVGGLGLTGLVTRAELQLRRVPGSSLEVENIRFCNLADFFALSRESCESHEYSVAWIDCLARGRSLGRGHFTRANHAAQPLDERPAAPRRQWAMPLTPPVSLVNRLTLRPFNVLYYWRQLPLRRRHASHLLPFFYPLDGIDQWNRMYGPAGFLQYQCVLPPQAAADGIPALLQEIARSGQGSFLAVLKQFGTRPSPGMLSFPRPGTTLALDFPNTGESLLALLRRLDQIVDAAGGAQYPAKDARMTATSFQQSYPRWQDFSRFIDPRFSSGFWRRVTE
ncbi:FAD-binding oxidoreductase [Stenotrophomonas maltophilia]|uniref:FAD-binding oxidoreductase n=1 Tax=Stenotrophomonas forensis TaxID=2871169 RepID=A0ABY7Y2Q0_9GAMM|nr:MULTISPECIES: FAD-binding oxidoreductase [Stenotrophomonas]ALA81092.1 FAD-linked oxidase [Stenotrophomonas maltophilia]MBH1477512.1 FAD-binding oxidoreductase [Stenotrophomonas maltophilia]MBH1502634.1 FAD-binding oxidoreductase [Stenotrophomonas maltophilia]MBH1787495.1 FAD-binding oxidoreductase [Stenotrophomonas maltophilia]WDM64216.1 FAD-binding oxidoreductase [Stenotrophomonas sp. DFS-20110405]